jgi:hypothetical protein
MGRSIATAVFGGTCLFSIREIFDSGWRRFESRQGNRSLFLSLSSNSPNLRILAQAMLSRSKVFWRPAGCW